MLVVNKCRAMSVLSIFINFLISTVWNPFTILSILEAFKGLLMHLKPESRDLDFHISQNKSLYANLHLDSLKLKS